MVFIFQRISVDSPFKGGSTNKADCRKLKEGQGKLADVPYSYESAYTGVELLANISIFDHSFTFHSFSSFTRSFNHSFIPLFRHFFNNSIIQSFSISFIHYGIILLFYMFFFL
jgi:hypothetical protein